MIAMQSMFTVLAVRFACGARETMTATFSEAYVDEYSGESSVFQGVNRTEVTGARKGEAYVHWPNRAVVAGGLSLGATGAVIAGTAVADSGLAAVGVAGGMTTLGMLTASTAANTASLVTLTAELSVATEFAGPTLGLAAMLGVDASVVSSMALVGSFIGPLLGAAVLIYVLWPDERIDHFARMEMQTSQVVDNRFNQVRKKKLGDRLKRYIRDFGRCAGAWTERATSNNTKLTDDNVPGVTRRTPVNQAVPPCMARLELSMSLERDEWTNDQGDTLSSLFMPFANLHTQLQTLLYDYPPIGQTTMKWDSIVQESSAEYALFLSKQMSASWKRQVCKQVRLRYKKNGLAGGWKYFLTVLEPQWQPNADGKSCFDKCGGKSGWCNYCGGSGIGACCSGKGGDTESDVCNRFDVPTRKFKRYFACVHTDCAQTNSVYGHAVEVGRMHTWSSDWAPCQEYCQYSVGATHFSLQPIEQWTSSIHRSGEYICKCQKYGPRTTRIWKAFSTSGPTTCPQANQEKSLSDSEREARMNVPTDEVQPCSESPPVQNLEELQMYHMPWMKSCYEKATGYLLPQFNSYHTKFVPFMDKLTRDAGCVHRDDAIVANTSSPQTDNSSEHNNTDVKRPMENFEAMSRDFSFATFHQCGYDHESAGSSGEWQPDDEKPRGWFGLSRIDTGEQSRLDLPFALPMWLQRRQEAQQCLKRKVQGETAGRALPKEKTEQEAMVSRFAQHLPRTN